MAVEDWVSKDGDFVHKVVGTLRLLNWGGEWALLSLATGKIYSVGGGPLAEACVRAERLHEDFLKPSAH